MMAFVMKDYLAPRLLFAVAALGILPMLGCASDEPVYTSSEPPAVEFEEIPRLNAQTEVWRPGYWSMQEGQFVWVPGIILPRPSPTAVWKPARWTKHSYGWSFDPGHWQ